jgi:hypothetical protein
VRERGCGRNGDGVRAGGQPCSSTFNGSRTTTHSSRRDVGETEDGILILLPVWVGSRPGVVVVVGSSGICESGGGEGSVRGQVHRSFLCWAMNYPTFQGTRDQGACRLQDVSGVSDTGCVRVQLTYYIN